MTREQQGALFCILTAAAWSTTAIFSKYAYQAGVGVLTLLVVRNLLGAGCFWAILGIRRHQLPPRALLVRLLAFGMVGSSLQTFLFASALKRIDAGLASMLLYTYPAMVLVGAVLLGRETVSSRRITALAVASCGVALILSGSIGRDVDPAGVAFGLGSALSYTISVLISQALLRQVPPLTLAASMSTGASITFLAVALITRGVDFGFERWGWLALVALAFVPTLVGMSCSLAGVSRIGPSRASILFMLEVPSTVLAAALLFDERLRLTQLAGGTLVLAAVLLLQTQWSPFAMRRAAALREEA